MTPLETLAADWVAEHPEYDADLADLAAALAAVYDGEGGRSNPFLHLSMHLSITEQVSIDQPRGIAQAVRLLAARRGSLHAAQHEVMECLGEMMWTGAARWHAAGRRRLRRLRQAPRDALKPRTPSATPPAR